MGFFGGLKESVLRCDLLSCAPTLRVRGQPNYESLFGGFLSMIIMISFISIFATSFLQVVDKVNITSSTSTADDTTSTSSVDDLQFAIALQGVQLGGPNRYFSFTLQQVTMEAQTSGSPVWTRTQIFLSPCDIDDWKNVGDEFQQQFNAFGMSQMLCIQSGQNISMQGYEGSTTFKYLQLKVEQCVNNSFDVPCSPQPTINNFINSYLASNDYFQVKFFMVDTKFSSASQTPVSKVLEKHIFMSFSDVLGTKGMISIAEYQIDTDVSILPDSDINTITGSYILQHESHTISISSTHYVDVVIYKSTQKLTITREVVKLDEMLSYVGGLFGLLFSAITFFLSSYSQYRYELYAAQSAFTYDESGRKIKQKDLNFFTYLGYALYDWLNFFGIAPNWKKMEQIDKTRQQINSQLDVQFLFRKIRALQKMTKVLMDENKSICLLLGRQPTISQTMNQRKILQFYDKINPSFNQNYSSRKVQNDVKMELKNIIDTSEQFNKENLQKDISYQNETEINQDLQGDEQFQDVFQIIKNAFASLQNQKRDEIANKIRDNIPQKVKKYIKKKRLTKRITVQDISGNQFGFNNIENDFQKSMNDSKVFELNGRKIQKQNKS